MTTMMMIIIIILLQLYAYFLFLRQQNTVSLMKNFRTTKFPTVICHAKCDIKSHFLTTYLQETSRAIDSRPLQYKRYAVKITQIPLDSQNPLRSSVTLIFPQCHTP